MSPCSAIARLTAVERVLYALANWVSRVRFWWLATIEGIVIAAITPIIANVIKTSARVKALKYCLTPPRGI